MTSVFLVLLTRLVFALEVSIDAEVNARTGIIHGSMWTHSEETILWVDPLSMLPRPTTDQLSARTFPGKKSDGHIRWHEVAPGHLEFTSSLPKRYGDIGYTKRFGLFSNGGWHPQPVTGGEAISWDVTLRLEDTDVGAVGDEAGRGQVRWTGLSDRVSIAVVPKGTISTVESGDTQITLVSKRRFPKKLVSELIQLQTRRSGKNQGAGVLVQAPLRRRLARPGHGLAYISDRAYRVTLGFQRFHRVAVASAVTEAWLDVSDPERRELLGAVLWWRHRQSLRGANAETLLKKSSFIPAIFWTLYSGNIPFAQDILESPIPGDPLKDDLHQLLRPHAPMRLRVAQIADHYGEPAVQKLEEALSSGETLADVEESASLPPGTLGDWYAPYPDQNYSVKRDDHGGKFVEREAAPDALSELVILRVDGEDEIWETGVGPGKWDLPANTKRIQIDPSGHTIQRQRMDDRWPDRWLPTFSGWLNTIAPSEGYASAGLTVALRRASDTQNTWYLTAATNRYNLVSLSLTLNHGFGKKLDGLRRRHQVRLGLAGDLLDPRLLDDTLAMGLGVYSVYQLDTRVDTIFPTRGQAFWVSASGGTVPALAQSYAGISSGFVQLMSPHPHHVFATRVGVGLADSKVTNTKLNFGGSSNLLSLPTDTYFGARRAVFNVEYRWAVTRDASVPLLLAWGRELHLTTGFEAGVLYDRGNTYTALGATLGLNGVFSLLGLDTSMIGVTLGFPLWSNLEPAPSLSEVRWVLRWGQNY